MWLFSKVNGTLGFDCSGAPRFTYISSMLSNQNPPQGFESVIIGFICNHCCSGFTNGMIKSDRVFLPHDHRRLENSSLNRPLLRSIGVLVLYFSETAMEPPIHQSVVGAPLLS